ncbi:double zinc ribbon domain-containing protein [Paracoccus sp. TK19116]|uniref:Double zinc ribbon domain-containing protein n=1 Tax=Paracoccus albicereus TaxID=2922394 RepID=A0ABT1MRH5_9RHOB|nr:double zinc ribbon domain-containing protein [Paracoccus albicereus]MCQ0970900.1 double zinc ribbon domain-containing protein [Paracoccus albicereus]
MKGALRIVYPPQCLACGGGVAEDGSLCPDCWRETEFVTRPACTRCGVPLPGDGLHEAESHAEGDLCDDCILIPRPWQHGRAAMVYAGTARRLVLALKHGDRPDLAPPLAAWLARAAAPLVQPGTIVVPVPVHWRRMLKRRYNQAELLSRHLALHHGLLHLPDALKRIAGRPGQDHRNLTERFENVAGTIVANPRRAALLQDKSVLLVDDVMASGATLAASAEALALAGAASVSVCVLARAAKDH